MKGQLVAVRRTPALKRLYRAYQCGLCHGIGVDYGFAHRLFAGPDVVFYNLFLDVCAAAPIRVEHRACVVAPLVTRLPSALPTDRSRLAVAVGIWFGFQKLDDDWRDEGGWHRWLALRALRPAAAKAERLLVEAGFPIAEVQRWMAEQARIEAGGALSLDEAVVPTMEIARLTFGFAGTDAGVIDRERAGAIGAAIGRWLFYVDNLTDYRDDVKKGRYNAIARAWGAHPRTPEAGVRAALDGARASIAELRTLLGPLPLAPEAQYLRHTVVLGFSDRLVRLVQGPGPRVRAKTRSFVDRLRAALWAEFASQPWWRTLSRPQAAWAMAAATLGATRQAWASRWWPEEATPTALGLDTDAPLPSDALPPDVATLHGGGLENHEDCFAACCDLSTDGDFDFWDVCCISDDCLCDTMLNDCFSCFDACE